MDSKFGNYVETLSSATSSVSERINFVVLPCNYEVRDTNHNVIMTTFVDHQKPHVRDAVSKLTQNDSSRLIGFVVDLPCSSMIDVANEFGVPTYVFLTMNASFLSLMFHLEALRNDNEFDITELIKNDDPDAELVVPSFINPVPARVLPDMAVEKIGSHLFLNHFTRIRDEAKGIIVNTFMELESRAVNFLFDGSKLPPLYTVGPALCDSHVDTDTSIINWLDHQPRSSVLFLCFGNVGSFGEDQVKEIARALDNTGIRFLWSLRQRPSRSGQNSNASSGYNDSMEIMIKDFLHRTAGRGKIIGWAPQVAILSHQAVGGFVSHCGWNSVLESLWFGVPIATWPLYAEQQFNAFELVMELELAVEIKMDYVMDFRSEKDRTVVSAQEIEIGIKKVMEHDSDLRKRVKEISEKSRKTLMDGGSSYTSLGSLINNVIEHIP